MLPHVRLPYVLVLAAAVVGVATAPGQGIAAPPVTSSAPRVATRVFFQDDAARTVKWADLMAGAEPQLEAAQPVAGFPQIDAERQNLVQMVSAKGLILVGVHDDDDGAFQSGWVLIDTGVDEEEHGDHSHWSYPRSPRVVASMLDDKQGNPAHMYCYDDVFYVANDKLNGFTRLDPAQVDLADDVSKIQTAAVFHQGGGGHITLAATDKGLAFSSWNAREGENKGRVDVTRLSPPGQPELLGSVFLPHGGIHGAAFSSGKVFLAPSDGICWMTVPAELPKDLATLKVEHLSLGTDGEKPRRTGSFTTFGKYVAFVTGSGPSAELCSVDASQATPALSRIPLTMDAGSRPTGLAIIRPRRSSPLAFVFHDHAAETTGTCRMSLIETDPDQNDDWSDARVASVTDVGRAKVEGHGGHHAIAFDADRRRAVFTNPGDGNLVVYSLDERRPLQTFAVGGVPSKVLAVGGRGSRNVPQ